MEDTRTEAERLDYIERLARNEGAAMDLWWTVTGDDWAVPEWLPAKFLEAALAGK